MAEQIGQIYPTQIPTYDQDADIQEAFRLYHYGSAEYDVNNADTAELVNPSIAYTLNDLQDQIDDVAARPTGGGSVETTVPTEIGGNPVPEGYIWVDSDSPSFQGAYGATSSFTNDAPTANLTTGLIWVDKDTDQVTSNPFIPSTLLPSIATTSGIQIIKDKTLVSPREQITISATSATGTINFDAQTSSILYYTSQASGNFTLNLKGTGSATFNELLYTGSSLTVVFLNTNGTTARSISGLNIDGSAQTIKWQGGSAPTANANSIDGYTFVVIKTSENTYTVLGSMTRFA